MRDRIDDFGDDTAFALVTFTTEPLDDYRRRRELPFPILVDRNRATYEAYGFGRGSFRTVWGLATLRGYASILRRRGLGALERATDDTRQLGGDVVIAADGTLSWGHWGTGPADRPTVDEIVAAVEATRQV